MKTSQSVIAIIVVVTLAFAGLNLYRSNEQLRQVQQTLQSQLLSQAERDSALRLRLEAQVASLEANLTAASNQISNLSQALQEAREMADPNLSTLREEIRQDVEAELRENPSALARLTASQVTPEESRQLAGIQLAMQYGEFLTLLESDVDRRDRVAALLTSLMAEQSQAALAHSSGSMELDEYTQIQSTDYMLLQLSPLLTPEELDDFAAFRDSNGDRQLRRVYNAQIAMTAPALSEANRELLIGMMIERSQSNAAALQENMLLDDMSLSDARMQLELESLTLVRRRLENELGGEQLREALNFLDQQRAIMELTRTRSEVLTDR